MNLRKSLCTLSGDDYSIISQCDKGLQNLFAAIGLFVFFIFVLCFGSSYLTFKMLFQDSATGIILSVFFSLTISNIYLLLLYTLSKNVLPHIRHERARLFSIGIRICFICFIAVVVSKPVEVYLFSHQLIFPNQLNQEIEDYKTVQKTKYIALTDSIYKVETEQIRATLENQIKLAGNPQNVNSAEYTDIINEKTKKRDENILQMQNLIDNSNYYIKSIIILNTKHPVCWLFTLISITIFIVPSYLKNLLAEQSNYYTIKKKIETALILQEYASFKAKYNILFQTNFNTNKTFCESFVDAPFNTIRKKDEREFLKEDDLIAELYNV